MNVMTRPRLSPVTLTRLILIAVTLLLWETLARSGLLYRDVVPPLAAISAALTKLLVDPAFYRNLAVTSGEIAAALGIGGAAGLLTGLALGANPYLARAYEGLLYYLGPTPKIIFFPVMLMWFGTGAASKIAMGALSCFFPIAIAVAAAMRSIDGVYVRVGKSFRLSRAQMARKIYLPALRAPIVNGARIGLGVAVIGTLLAETKLSNQGLGFLVIQTYTNFDMPRMYALLIMVFVLAALLNAGLGALAKRG